MLVLKIKVILSIIFLLFCSVLCLQIISDEDHLFRNHKLNPSIIILVYVLLNLYQEMIFASMIIAKSCNLFTGLISVIMGIILNFSGVVFSGYLFFIVRLKFELLSQTEKLFCVAVFTWSCYPLVHFLLLKTLQIFNRIRYGQTPVGRRKLTIMSWNIQRGLDFYWKYEIDKTLQYIKRESPDIICLQEADLGEDFYKIKLLARDLKAELIQSEKGHESVVIISKFPVETIDVLELDSLSDKSKGESDEGSKLLVRNIEEERFMLSALINLDSFANISLWICNMHADSNWKLGNACKQILKCFEHTQKLEKTYGYSAKTLIGDLNMPASALVHRVLSQYMTDCWSLSGFGLLGWTASIGGLGRKIWALAHNVRLDYIYLNKAKDRRNSIMVGKTQLGEKKLSDHRAVITEIFY